MSSIWRGSVFMLSRLFRILFAIIGLILVLEGIWAFRIGLQISEVYPFQKQYRFLACVSSFKRPIFVSGQVLRLMNQTYPVDVSLSVKGVPKSFVETALMQEWEPFIQKGKLSVRVDENRDQYSNFLDTVRNVDLNKYDYFCKIDDDDWYGPDYFKHVNEWLNKDSDIDISSSTHALIVREGDKSVNISSNYTDLSGPSMCFSRKVIQAFLDIEKEPDLIKKYLPNITLQSFRWNREDNLYHKLARVIGKSQERLTPRTDLVFGWQYPSVMRGNYIK